MKEEKMIGGVLKGGTSDKYNTGNWKHKKPVWDSKRCVHCMRCVPLCPENCIKVKRDKKGNIKRIETDLSKCKGCGICERVCPVKCIKMEEE